MSLREDLAAMLAGYRTTAAEPAISEPPAEIRHAEPAQRRKTPVKKRATVPAKALVPETMDPSPE